MRSWDCSNNSDDLVATDLSSLPTVSRALHTITPSLCHHLGSRCLSFQVKNEEIREVTVASLRSRGGSQRGENNPNEFCLALKCALLAAVPRGLPPAGKELIVTEG